MPRCAVLRRTGSISRSMCVASCVNPMVRIESPRSATPERRSSSLTTEAIALRTRLHHGVASRSGAGRSRASAHALFRVASLATDPTTHGITRERSPSQALSSALESGSGNGSSTLKEVIHVGLIPTVSGFLASAESVWLRPDSEALQDLSQLRHAALLGRSDTPHGDAEEARYSPIIRFGQLSETHLQKLLALPA